MADVFPHTEDAKVLWNQNMKEKILVQGPILGLTALEVTEMATISDDIIAAIGDNAKAHVAALSSTANKDAVLEKSEKEQRVVIKRMKSNKNFTKAIGEDLQIVGSDSVAKPEVVKPVIKAAIKPGKVVISFAKGKLDGMNIYERLSGATSWVKLAYNSYSPYEDKRPLAVEGVSEHREYMGIGVVHDEEVTIKSDIIEAIFGG